MHVERAGPARQQRLVESYRTPIVLRLGVCGRWWGLEEGVDGGVHRGVDAARAGGGLRRRGLGKRCGWIEVGLEG